MLLRRKRQSAGQNRISGYNRGEYGRRKHAGLSQVQRKKRVPPKSARLPRTFKMVLFGFQQGGKTFWRAAHRSASPKLRTSSLLRLIAPSFFSGPSLVRSLSAVSVGGFGPVRQGTPFGQILVVLVDRGAFLVQEAVHLRRERKIKARCAQTQMQCFPSGGGANMPDDMWHKKAALTRQMGSMS